MAVHCDRLAIDLLDVTAFDNVGHTMLIAAHRITDTGHRRATARGMSFYDLAAILAQCVSLSHD
jgi:hypothetical protein